MGVIDRGEARRIENGIPLIKFCSNVANAKFDSRNSGSAEADNDAVFDGTSDEVIHGSLLRGRHDVLRLRSKIIHRNAEGVRDLMRTREVFGFERDVGMEPLDLHAVSKLLGRVVGVGGATCEKGCGKGEDEGKWFLRHFLDSAVGKDAFCVVE